MPDLDRETQRDRLERKRAESSTMLAILMAGVAALFIIGIVTAFNYAANSPASGVSAQAPAPAPAASETTGSGSAPAAPAPRER